MQKRIFIILHNNKHEHESSHRMCGKKFWKRLEKIKLGSTVKDRITGLQGVVMARTEYLTGCAHVAILATKLSKEGKIPEWEWIDEVRCILDKVKEVVRLSKPVVAEGNGGVAPNAPER